MESSGNEVAHEFPPFLRIKRDGTVERFFVSPYLPPTTDPITGVESKNVVISPEINLKARVCTPKISGTDSKLPLVVHYHGGGFCIGSAFGSMCNHFLVTLASQANAIVVSVDYRLAPEHPLPIAYHDSWAALQWIATHKDGQGSDPWINQYADFGRVFLIGESASANLAHYVAVQAGASNLDLSINGLILVHPYFADKKPDKLIQYLYPGSSGTDDDPKLNPGVDPQLCKMKCGRVWVCVAEKDWLKARGVAYYERLKDSGWRGEVELIENEGEDHCFHLFNADTDKASSLRKMFASLITSN